MPPKKRTTKKPIKRAPVKRAPVKKGTDVKGENIINVNPKIIVGAPIRRYTKRLPSAGQSHAGVVYNPSPVEFVNLSKTNPAQMNDHLLQPPKILGSTVTLATSQIEPAKDSLITQKQTTSHEGNGGYSGRLNSLVKSDVLTHDITTDTISSTPSSKTTSSKTTSSKTTSSKTPSSKKGRPKIYAEGSNIPDIEITEKLASHYTKIKEEEKEKGLPKNVRTKKKSYSALNPDGRFALAKDLGII